MKIRIFCFIVLFLCVFAWNFQPGSAYQTAITETADTMLLASWNIRIFSDGSRDDTELRQICQILMDYDFIAILELRDEEILKRAEAMLQTMGKDYDYQISSKVGRGVKELYAFLYDTSKVRVVKEGTIVPDPDDAFIREPYYATFRVGEFDFTVIVIHVIWGDRVADRRAEISRLDEVYMAVQDEDGAEQDILLVGDFNMPPDDESYSGLKAIDSMTHLFRLPDKSHIEDTSLYDNIWFQAKYLNEYVGNSGIDKFDETDFDDDDDAASLAVSDHRPVWAEFYIHTDDDGEESSHIPAPPEDNPWDINRDRVVDHWDIKIVCNYFGEMMPVECLYNPDVDGSGKINILDLVLVSVHYGESYAKPVTPTENDPIVYITETGTKYHRAGCRYLSQSAIPIRRSEAIERGYTPCSVCKPDEAE